MKKIILQILFVSISITIFSQIEIKILDSETKLGIEDVFVSNSDNSIFAISDANGFAEINISNLKDSIFFQHIAYEVSFEKISEIKNNENKVFLNPKGIVIDVTTISVNKNKQRKERISNKVDVIDIKKIELLNPQTSAELLETTGNVFIQKSQGGGGSPIIRGFEANKVLLAVDGVRMNNAIYRGGHLQNAITIDESMLERVEIVYGPGSLIYGSDALGGVVHFYTKKPKFSNTDKKLIKANAMTRFSTVNQEKTAHFDFNIGTKKFASLSSFSYSNFGDSETGKKINSKYGTWGQTPFYVKNEKIVINDDPFLQKKTAYNQIDLMQKFRYKKSDFTFFELNIQYSTSSNIDRYDKLSVTKNKEVSDTSTLVFISAEQNTDSTFSIQLPKYTDWYYGPQKRILTALTANFNRNKLMFNKATVILSYQNIEESRYKRKFANSTLTSNIEKLNIVTFNADFKKDYKKSDLKKYLLYGLELNYNNVESKGLKTDIFTKITKNAQSRYPDEGSVVFTSAIYGKYTHNYSKKLKLSAGLRFNNNFLHSKFSSREFSGENFSDINLNNYAFSTSLNLIYVPFKDLQINTLFSTGFRAPNVDDIGKVFDPNDLQIVIPNSNLKPEFTYNFELGFVKKFKNKARIDLVGFYTLLDNFIQREPFNFNGLDSVFVDEDTEKSQVLANVNTGQAFMTGASLNIKSQIIKNLNIVGSVNYTFGLVNDETPVSHIPPMFGRLALNYKVKSFKGSIYTKFSAWKHTWDYSPLSVDNLDEATEDGTPAWATLNLNASHNFSKYIIGTIGVENVFDIHYRPFGSGISANGRNIVFSFRGSF